MDDYFSGLLSRHINELRLDNADEQNVEIEEKSEKKEKVENIPEEKESVDYHSSEHSRSLSPSPSPSPPSSMNEKTVQSSSTTTSSTGSNSSSQYVSLRDYQAPQINHERDVPQQLLVALIGREFDEPQLIVSKLNSLIPLLPHGSTVPVLKLIPFTVRRSVLVKANFDWQELKELDLVCMCYNASEARILLTGPDGFYTQLIKKLEAVLGSNKIAFLITNYLSEENSSLSSPLLIDTKLRTRLTAQTSLATYLETNQVLSWFQDPCESHVTKLIELAHSEPNPSNFCLIL